MTVFTDYFGRPRPIRHEGLGPGYRVRVDRGWERRPLEVEVFPQTRVVRLHSPLVDITLRSVRVSAGSDEETLVLAGEVEDEWMLTSLGRDGLVLTSRNGPL